MTPVVTLGPTFGPIWNVWIQNRRGEFRFVCATSCKDRLAFAIGSIREMVG